MHSLEDTKRRGSRGNKSNDWALVTETEVAGRRERSRVETQRARKEQTDSEGHQRLDITLAYLPLPMRWHFSKAKAPRESSLALGYPTRREARQLAGERTNLFLGIALLWTPLPNTTVLM